MAHLLILNDDQRKAMWLLAEAFGSLSDNWSEELGDALRAHGVLPIRCVTETNHLYQAFYTDSAVPLFHSGKCDPENE